MYNILVQIVNIRFFIYDLGYRYGGTRDVTRFTNQEYYYFRCRYGGEFRWNSTSKSRWYFLLSKVKSQINKDKKISDPVKWKELSGGSLGTTHKLLGHIQGVPPMEQAHAPHDSSAKGKWLACASACLQPCPVPCAQGFLHLGAPQQRWLQCT